MGPAEPSGNGSFTSIRERRAAERLDRSRFEAERRGARRVLVQRIALGSTVVVAAVALLVYVRFTREPEPALETSPSAVSRGGDRSPTVGSSTGLAPSTPPPTRSGAAASPPSPTGAGPASQAATVSADQYSGVRAAASSRAVQLYGMPRSGLPWHSGFWTGGKIDTAHSEAAGSWRGRPMDFATVYPLYGTWAAIEGSGWAVTNFRGFKGHLAYGLPLLPTDRKGHWEDVTDGSHDGVFRGIAQVLVSNGQPDAAIRMGVEANGYWFPWAVDTANLDRFKAAFRHIETVMKAVAPRLTFWLDLNCGTVLTGSSDRLAPLTQMYPGDDLVDGISMDHYNAYKLAATDELSWQVATAPSYAPGLQDGVDFARAHHKGFALPEWGLHDKQGPGDSPYFMSRIFKFFMDNRDVLVYENYFNEPDSYIASGLFDATNNPKSAAVYRRLWGRRS
jgi:hypothetical protein